MARSTLTRDQILGAARDLIIERGFAATSIADIAGAVGTSKAGIYYHFNSKAQILDGLSHEHLDALDRLASWAEESGAAPKEVLEAFIDGAIATGPLIVTLWSDPSARAGLDMAGFSEHCDRILDVIAPPTSAPAVRTRARAALAVAQNAPRLLSMAPEDARLQARAAVLSAAVGALGALPDPSESTDRR